MTLSSTNIGRQFAIDIVGRDSFTPTLSRISTGISKFGVSLDRLAISTTRSFEKLGAGVQRVGQSRGLDSLHASVAKMGTGVIGATRSVSSLGLKLSGVGLVAGAASSALAGFGLTTAAEAAQRLKNLSGVLGVSTQALQRYEGAAKIAGVGTEAMDSAMAGFQKAVNEGFGDNANSGMVASFGQLGVSLTKASLSGEGLLDTLMKVVAAIYDKSDNPGARQAAAEKFGLGPIFAMFAGGGLGQFLGYLKQSKDAGAETSKSVVDGAAKVAESIAKMTIGLESSGMKLTKAVSPSIGKLTEGVLKLNSAFSDTIATNIGNFLDGLGSTLTGIDWPKFTKDAREFKDVLKDISGIASSLTGGAIGGKSTGISDVASKIGQFVGGTAPKFDIAHPVSSWNKMADFYGAPHAGSAVSNLAFNLGTGIQSTRNWEHSTPQMDRMRGRSATGGLSDTAAKQEYLAQLERQYGLPTGMLDTIWALESSRGTNPKKNVPGVQGALGDFQFTTRTGREYGATGEFYGDGDAAARKAVDLLRWSKGDLAKAFAGYNAGEGRVTELGMNNLPSQTRPYVSNAMRLMGAAQSEATVTQSPAAAPGTATVRLIFDNPPPGLRARSVSQNLKVDLPLGMVGLVGAP